MKKAILFIILVNGALQLTNCKSYQPLNFSKITDDIDSIVIYDRQLVENAGNNIENSICANFNIEIFKELIPSLIYENKTVIFKGGLDAVIYLKDNKNINIIISNYGGFFIRPGEKGFYRFCGNAQDKFNQIYYDKILNGIIIPKRKDMLNQ